MGSSSSAEIDDREAGTLHIQRLLPPAETRVPYLMIKYNCQSPSVTRDMVGREKTSREVEIPHSSEVAGGG